MDSKEFEQTVSGITIIVVFIIILVIIHNNSLSLSPFIQTLFSTLMHFFSVSHSYIIIVVLFVTINFVINPIINEAKT